MKTLRDKADNYLHEVGESEYYNDEVRSYMYADTEVVRVMLSFAESLQGEQPKHELTDEMIEEEAMMRIPKYHEPQYFDPEDRVRRRMIAIEMAKWARDYISEGSKAPHECRFYVNADWTKLRCECGNEKLPESEGSKAVDLRKELENLIYEMKMSRQFKMPPLKKMYSFIDNHLNK